MSYIEQMGDGEQILACQSVDECVKVLKKLKYKPATITRASEGATHAKPDFAGYRGVKLTDSGVMFWTRFGRHQNFLNPHTFGVQRIRVKVEYDSAWKKQVVVDLPNGEQEFKDEFEHGVSHREFSFYCDIDDLDKIIRENGYNKYHNVKIGHEVIA